MTLFRSKRKTNSSSNALIIFTREPVAGKTKTRLMPYYTPEQCAMLHKCFIRDIAKEMKSADADIVVAYTGGEPAFLRKVFGRSSFFIEQKGRDIGERMKNAIADALSLGYEKAVLVGTDIPELEAETIDTAFTMLDASDAVIGPTEDGGYYLIGMKQVLDEPFEVKLYGTDTVYAETTAFMRNAGIVTEEVEPYSDIDTPEDLAGFRSRMREDAHLRHTRTGRFIAETAKISVIVPVFNEAATIEGLLRQLEHYGDECEVIIVDGGSTDGTLKKIGGRFRVIQSSKGRGPQMNAGAMESSGDILFFLHCDSRLPEYFVREIRKCMMTCDYGCFGVKFPSRNFFMLTNRIISNHRAAVRGLPFGDQGIFIDRRLFFEVGMFPEIPVMEDYAFARKMRRYGYKPGMTGHRIETSARRYGSGTLSILKTEFRMWDLRRRFRKGDEPESIASKYTDIR